MAHWCSACCSCHLRSLWWIPWLAWRIPSWGSSPCPQCKVTRFQAPHEPQQPQEKKEKKAHLSLKLSYGFHHFGSFLFQWVCECFFSVYFPGTRGLVNFSIQRKALLLPSWEASLRSLEFLHQRTWSFVVVGTLWILLFLFSLQASMTRSRKKIARREALPSLPPSLPARAPPPVPFLGSILFLWVLLPFFGFAMNTRYPGILFWPFLPSILLFGFFFFCLQ